MPLFLHHSRRVLPVVIHSQISSARSCGTGSGGLPGGLFSVLGFIDDFFPSIRGLCSSLVLANFLDGAQRDVEDLGQFAVAHFLVFVHVTDLVYNIIWKAGIVMGCANAVSLFIYSYKLHPLLTLHFMSIRYCLTLRGFLALVFSIAHDDLLECRAKLHSIDFASSLNFPQRYRR